MQVTWKGFSNTEFDDGGIGGGGGILGVVMFSFNISLYYDI